VFPEVTLDPPPSTFYSTMLAQVKLTATDDKMLADLSVTLDGKEVDLAPGEDFWLIELPCPPSDGKIAVLDVAATDLAGNQTAVLAEYLYDGQPPGLTLESPLPLVFPALDGLECLVSIDEDGSGVATVSFAENPDTWTATQQPEGGWLLEGSAAEPEFSGDTFLFEQKIVVADAVGNKSELTIPFYVDLVNPTVAQAPSTFADESQVKPVYDDAAGELTYNDQNADDVVLSEVTCDPKCPDLPKFASRLSYKAETDIAAKNLPVFKFSVKDVSFPKMMKEPTVAVSYEIFHGEESLGQGALGTLPCDSQEVVQVPVAADLFSDQPDDPDFDHSVLPDRIVISAVDPSGRTTTFERSFGLKVLPPPVFIFPAGPGDLPMVAAEDLMSTQAPALHQMTQLHPTFVRVRAVNPTSVTAVIKSCVAPVELLNVQKSKIYADGTGVKTYYCAQLNHCTYGTDGVSYGSCGVPQEFTDQDWKDGEVLSQLMYDDPVTGEYVSLVKAYVEPPALIPPQTSIWIDVNSGLLEKDWLKPPEQLVSAGGVPFLAHTVSPTTYATCTTQLFNPPKMAAFSVPEIVTSYASQTSQDKSLALKIRALGGQEEKVVVQPVYWKLSYQAPADVLKKTFP